MPNWIEGTLKLRGKVDDLRRFFDTAIQPCTISNTNPEPQKREAFIVCTYNDQYNEIEMKEDAYIEGTRRAFVNDNCYVYFEDDNENVTVCFPIRQAWAFVTENWKELSKKYNLDIRLYGFERGMEFCQEVEVINGEITIDKVVEYDDWDWECPMSLMGG